ncbi:MAG TPA: GTPase Era [Steroidobacteraceae bacterium]|nr:GTPase Era [Steroidobacteraceae bacterium]HRX90793.1 GTPase Era [Steroidobacteraceae bacterium]
MSFRAGFVALVGRPNVGKSTLLNALVGEKLSIVTPRPQTTRHRVLGLLNGPDYQIAFVDTPGLHLGAKRALNRAMNRTAAAALVDADLLVFVAEATRFTDEDAMALERVKASGLPTLAVVSKIDRMKRRDLLLPFIAELATRHEFAEILPLSAAKGVNVARLVELIAQRLPESEALYPLEQRTDRSIEFQIAETIREKLTLELVQELPYGIAVHIERLAEEEGQLVVDATIWVDRAGQKPIVIGARGERLKRVGRAARMELNSRLDKRLHLQLWVKVRDDWADNAEALRSLGLE